MNLDGKNVVCNTTQLLWKVTYEHELEHCSSCLHMDWQKYWQSGKSMGHVKCDDTEHIYV